MYSLSPLSLNKKGFECPGTLMENCAVETDDFQGTVFTRWHDEPTVQSCLFLSGGPCEPGPRGAAVSLRR